MRCIICGMFDFAVWYRILTWIRASCCLCRLLRTLLDFCAMSHPDCYGWLLRLKHSVSISTSCARAPDSSSRSTRIHYSLTSTLCVPWPFPRRTRGNCPVTIRSTTPISLTRVYWVLWLRHLLFSRTRSVTLLYHTMFFLPNPQDMLCLNHLTSYPLINLHRSIYTYMLIHYIPFVNWQGIVLSCLCIN